MFLMYSPAEYLFPRVPKRSFCQTIVWSLPPKPKHTNSLQSCQSSCSIFLLQTLHTTNMPPSRAQRPRNGPGADSKRYICGLCGQGFSQRYTVYDSHFQSCVKRNGNPNKLPWDSHPSCQPQGLGPKGTAPPSKTYKVSQFMLRGPDGHELI